jgi:hypothetical protein
MGTWAVVASMGETSRNGIFKQEMRPSLHFVAENIELSPLRFYCSKAPRVV